MHRQARPRGQRRVESRAERLGGEDGYRNWRAKRARYLAAHPACVRCGARATVADHIIKRREWVRRGYQGSPDVWSNLQAMCKRCHDRKTAKGW